MILAALLLIAQSLTASPVSTVEITFGRAFTIPVAALEWTLTLPAGVSVISWTEEQAAYRSGKTLTCSGSTCLLYGMNATPIQTGLLATAVVSGPGAASVSIIAVGPDGSAVTVKGAP